MPPSESGWSHSGERSDLENSGFRIVVGITSANRKTRDFHGFQAESRHQGQTLQICKSPEPALPSESSWSDSPSKLVRDILGQLFEKSNGGERDRKARIALVSVPMYELWPTHSHQIAPPGWVDTARPTFPATAKLLNTESVAVCFHTRKA